MAQINSASTISTAPQKGIYFSSCAMTKFLAPFSYKKIFRFLQNLKRSTFNILDWQTPVKTVLMSAPNVGTDFFFPGVYWHKTK